MSFDATNREQVDHVINAAADALGGLHILVNSASLPGGHRPAPPAPCPLRPQPPIAETSPSTRT